jgi:arylsulfatase A-like enzyme
MKKTSIFFVMAVFFSVQELLPSDIRNPGSVRMAAQGDFHAGARVPVPPRTCLLDRYRTGQDSKGNEPLFVEKAMIGNEYRDALRTRPEVPLVWETKIPSNGMLEFGYALFGDIPSAGDVTIEVAIQRDDMPAEKIFSESTKAATAQSAWRDVRLDLSGDAGNTVKLLFSCCAAKDTPGTILWSSPVIWQNPPERKEYKNIILISLDTLRADHLGCYGNRRKCSPAIDRFAAQGGTFKKCIAPSPWTLPSHASLFTSLYPASHGLQYTHDFDTLRPFLPRSALTLARLLQNYGYFTAAIGEGGPVSPAFGLLLGFDFFLDSPKREAEEVVERDGVAVTIPVDQAAGTFSTGIRWITENREKPFFLFLHTYETHLPYRNTAFSRKYDPDYLGRIKQGRTDEYMEISNEARARKSVEPGEFQHMSAQYDAHVAMLDIWIGRLCSAIEELDLLHNTLIVITADHGEYLLDRDFKIEHGQDLYRELIHIPLIMVDHDRIPEGVVIDDGVSLLDITPTVLDYLGVGVPETMHGSSLLSLIKGKEENGRYVFAEAPVQGKYVAVVDTREGYKYIFRIFDGQDELYDVRKDPREQNNMCLKNPAKASALRRRVEEYLTVNDPGYYLIIVGKEGESVPWDKIKIYPEKGGEFFTAWNMSLDWLEEWTGRSYSFDRKSLILPRNPDKKVEGFYFRTEPGIIDIQISLEGYKNHSGFPLFLGENRRQLKETMIVDPRDCSVVSKPSTARPGLYLFTYAQKNKRDSGPGNEREAVSSEVRRPGQFDDRAREKLKALGYIQ